MDEARAVMSRLERIERLRADGGPRATLLAEVQKLLEEGEAWVAAERAGTEQARDVLELCRHRLESVGDAAPSAA